jgi:transforming growth factor-beta-induced protein
MSRLSRLYSLLAAGLILVLAACATVANPVSLSEALDDPQLSDLKAALEAEGLISALEGQSAVTIFAPTNAAFSALQAQQGLPLADVLSYHAVPGATALSGDLVDGQLFGTLYANSALGVDVNGGVTLNDGSGEVITVVEADIEIANGVIHKIDAVLTPPSTIAGIAVGAGTGPDGFSTLVEALTALNLVGNFDGNDDGPFTVFAPTNAAFDNLLTALNLADLDALVDALGAEVVTQILLHHVVDGVVDRSEAIGAATAGTPVDTLSAGNPLNLSLDGGNVEIASPDGVGPATVTATNIPASNGTIHVVDEVIVFDLGN